MMNERVRYNDFSGFMSSYFPYKVQKISVNAGFTCPNRDGSRGYGGCTYCNNQSFNPAYCHTEKSVARQVAEGVSFFSRKYPRMKYLAYFQAYTNTYAELETLKRMYEEALEVDGVVGLVIGTRPDCMPEALLDYLEELGRRTTVDAVERTARRHILTGGHVILGLPGEDRERILVQAARISELPLNTLKLHQLQLVRGTRMAHEYEEHPDRFHLYDVDEYVDLVVDYVERLRPDIVLERFVSQSPKELLIAPDWGLKNYEFTEKVKKRLAQRDTWQGKYYGRK